MNIKFDRRIFNDVYIPTYKCEDSMLLLYGGGGSGKSEWAAQKLLRRMLKETPHRFLITRKVAATIRNSQIALLKDIVARWKLQSLFEFTDLTVRCANGNEIVSSGMDNPEKLKSIAGITGIWAEELTEFTREDVMQLRLRMRGKSRHYKQFIGTFNPIDIEHWLRKEYFPAGNTKENKIRFRLNEDGNFGELYCTALRTTFADNKFIADDDKAILLASEKQDKNFYNIYARGLWGAKIEGLFYTNYTVVEEMPKNLDYECYGLDFGFTHPTALQHIGIKDGKVYARLLLYRSNLTNPKLIAELNSLIHNRGTEIFADSAAPDKIEEIYNAGFNIHAANKNVEHGIEVVQSVELNITADSHGTLKEIIKYGQLFDKNGKPTGKVRKIDDDAMDALRYGIYSAWIRYGAAVFGKRTAQYSTAKIKERKERRSRDSDFANY